MNNQHTYSCFAHKINFLKVITVSVARQRLILTYTPLVKEIKKKYKCFILYITTNCSNTIYHLLWDLKIYITFHLLLEHCSLMSSVKQTRTQISSPSFVLLYFPSFHFYLIVDRQMAVYISGNLIKNMILAPTWTETQHDSSSICRDGLICVILHS